jgi:hypothetical protein
MVEWPFVWVSLVLSPPPSKSQQPQLLLLPVVKRPLHLLLFPLLVGGMPLYPLRLGCHDNDDHGDVQIDAFAVAVPTLIGYSVFIRQSTSVYNSYPRFVDLGALGALVVVVVVVDDNDNDDWMHLFRSVRYLEQYRYCGWLQLCDMCVPISLLRTIYRIEYGM